MIESQKNGQSPRPAFVIEVKRVESRSNKTSRNAPCQKSLFVQSGLKLLQDHLPQLFEYLRLLCLEHHLRSLCGVLTNYQDWIFVRFSLQNEARSVYERVTPIPHPIFEVSGNVRLRDGQFFLQQKVLAQISKVIIDNISAQD